MPLGHKNANLLGVICIIAVLLALLLPAVQKVRDAAARMSCRNNLMQLGFAVHNYHDTSTRFPPGTMPNPALTPEQRLSFHVAVQPFVESSNVFKRVAQGEAWDSPTNTAVLGGRFKVYECPTRIADGEAVGRTNYVGVAGVGADAATRPADAPGNGVFGYDRTTKKDDVKDGLENTALLVETNDDVGPWYRGGPATVRAIAEGVTFGGTHDRRTWTFQKRPGGFNVLLADASVRFTRPDVSPEVLAALATVAGREEIPADW